MLIMKFGGTSLEDADKIREVVNLVLESRGDDLQTVVVVSAMAGTTNTLLAAARVAAAGKKAEHQESLAALAARGCGCLPQLALADVAGSDCLSSGEQFDLSRSSGRDLAVYATPG